MSACQQVKEESQVQLNCQEKRNFNLNFYDRESEAQPTFLDPGSQHDADYARSKAILRPNR